MRRLLICLSILAVALVATSAIAKISSGDQKKIKRWMGAYLDPSEGKEKQRSDALKEFSNHFTDRRAAQLKDVKILADLLANAGERDSHRPGVHRKTIVINKKKGIKFDYVISVPKKYRGNTDGWPLVVSLPDKGQSAEDYLSTYFASQAIRDTYLICVMDFDYEDITKKESKQVEDPDEPGKVKFEEVETKVPFAWTEDQAYRQFWLTLLEVMVKTFHVNPNRVILDGAGIGSTGAIHFGAGVSWRFAGLIIRGGVYEGPVLENLVHLPVLAYPYATAGEKAGETLKAIEGHMEGGLTRAGDEAGWDGKDKAGGAELKTWLDQAVRVRHPLPSTWTATAPRERFGYWCYIGSRYDEDAPARMKITNDLKANKIEITAENVSEFNLFLNDLLVDLDKQFEVWVNGELVGEYKKDRVADQLLAHAFAHADGKAPNDPGCVFVNELERIPVAEVKKDGDGD